MFTGFADFQFSGNNVLMRPLPSIYSSVAAILHSIVGGLFATPKTMVRFGNPATSRRQPHFPEDSSCDFVAGESEQDNRHLQNGLAGSMPEITKKSF